MEYATIEKIFDPFFTTKFTGRGLGMSAVLGIMRGHRGALRVYSEMDKGTTFKILFPANEQTGNDLSANNEKDSVLTGWSGDGTILIVDDEQTIRDVGRRMLERLGFKVLTADNGLQAVDLFRIHQNDITCTLLDLMMPHMDGEETFRRMRQINPDVSVILCSGYNELDAVQRFAGKGLGGFLQKPYTLEALQGMLEAALTSTTPTGDELDL